MTADIFQHKRLFPLNRSGQCTHVTIHFFGSPCQVKLGNEIAHSMVPGRTKIYRNGEVQASGWRDSTGDSTV